MILEMGDLNMLMALVQRVDAWDRLMAVRIFTWPSRSYLDRLMYGVSRSGDGPLYLVVALLVLLLVPQQAGNFVMAGLIAFAMELSLYKVLKQTTKRDRPCSADLSIRHRIKPPDQFSFPSGHTAAAFLMASLISAFWPVATPICFIWASLVGFSRVYNGVHYISDIIAGSILGLFTAQAGLAIIL
jgi:undecaprenyl-diphosphatase